MGKTIKLTRGDTAHIFFKFSNATNRVNMLTDGTESENVLADGDSAVFSLKRESSDDEIILQKSLSVTGEIVIDPVDTSSLEFGTYRYDVQVTWANGEVNTVVTPHDFIVDEEVTTSII